MQGPTSNLYFSQRLRLHYVDWGNPEAPAMLMIHGTRDHCRNWDWAAERLRDRYHIIAPDLRGHGDSAWAIGASYSDINYVYDIAQLVQQKRMAPVTIMAHSLGGMVALLYSGIFPETVRKVIAIDGMGPPPQAFAMQRDPLAKRVRDWIETQRRNAGRVSRKYPTLEAAVMRMKEENDHLSDEQARHLTIHGAAQNEDGTYSWKFDNYARMGGGPSSMTIEEQNEVWKRISAPVLLVNGAESWGSHPEVVARAENLRNARVVNVEGAGHWVHHDRFDVFMDHVEAFLAEDS